MRNKEKVRIYEKKFEMDFKKSCYEAPSNLL